VINPATDQKSDRPTPMEASGKKYVCPVEATLDILGGKWKVLILHELFSGTKRFGELRRAIPAATQRMLTLQLRELERDGVLHRHVYAEIPPKVEYSLTELGASLEGPMNELLAWAEKYLHYIQDADTGAGSEDEREEA
jgi:DNA-binding HxlR family transcriptional regulator